METVEFNGNSHCICCGYAYPKKPTMEEIKKHQAKCPAIRRDNV